LLERLDREPAEGAGDHEAEDEECGAALDNSFGFAAGAGGEGEAAQRADGAERTDEEIAVEKDEDQAEWELDESLSKGHEEGDVGDAVGHGVEDFAEVGDLVPSSRDEPIEEIRTFADDQQSQQDIRHIRHRNPKPLMLQIKNGKSRTNENSEKCEEVGQTHKLYFISECLLSAKRADRRQPRYLFLLYSAR